MLLERKQNKGIQVIDYPDFTTWEHVTAYILGLFKIDVNAVSYMETKQADGKKSASIRNRSGIIILQLKTV